MSACKPLSIPRIDTELSIEQSERKILNDVDKKRYQAITSSRCI